MHTRLWNSRQPFRKLSALLAATMWCALTVRAADPVAPPRPSLKICVAGDATPDVQRAAQDVLAAAATQPLLQAMSKDSAPRGLTDSKALAEGEVGARAYSHLVVIGSADDPLIRLLSQREARIEQGGMYIYGWGHLQGDIGYVESARNPFLHSVAIPSIPYETEVVTLTGTTPKGVEAAVAAFLKTDLCNGVVAGPAWKRGQANLLDRDPVLPSAGPPAWIPPTLGAMKRIGVISGSEDEYRGVLADAGKAPQEIWRVKYLGANSWETGGDYKQNAPAIFEAGLHRRASGNSLWVARFSSAQEAAECMQKIASQDKFQAKDKAWYGERPGFSKGPSAGPLALWQYRNWLLMSTLPGEETAAAMAEIHD